ncbi:hypothetical protein EBU99_13980 [bacterium]|nr:hypothetical protein [bacterium]
MVLSDTGSRCVREPLKGKQLEEIIQEEAQAQQVSQGRSDYTPQKGGLDLPVRALVAALNLIGERVALLARLSPV